MSIQQADKEHLNIIKTIVISTIKEIYPRYYPRGAVDFFLSHHHEEAIAQDVQAGSVFLICDHERQAVGTVTMKANEICRLFVLPQYQNQGFGRQLLDFAEARISGGYNTAILDASLPAKAIYLKRGYLEIETHSIETESGDFLCYDVMQKNLSSITTNENCHS